MKNEAHARIKINQLLQEAGWRFFDNENGKERSQGVSEGRSGIGYGGGTVNRII